MNESLILFIAIGVFHFLDMFFTVKYIMKKKKKYVNPEDLEVNFHKYFWKKFGLIKGSIFSFIISLSLIMFIVYVSYLYDIKIVYMVLGMVIMVAYINIQSYFNSVKLKERKGGD